VITHPDGLYKPLISQTACVACVSDTVTLTIALKELQTESSK